jgi:hypothetical protein
MYAVCLCCGFAERTAALDEAPAAEAEKGFWQEPDQTLEKGPASDNPPRAPTVRWKQARALSISSRK